MEKIMNYIYESACKILEEKPGFYSILIDLKDDNIFFSIKNEEHDVVLEQTISKSESYSTREIYDLMLSHVNIEHDIISECLHDFYNGIENKDKVLRWMHCDNENQILMFEISVLGEKDFEWFKGKIAFDDGRESYMQHFQETIAKYKQDYQKIQNDILNLQEKKVDDSVTKARK